MIWWRRYGHALLKQVGEQLKIYICLVTGTWPGCPRVLYQFLLQHKVDNNDDNDIYFIPSLHMCGH